jgi:hypothetical protein
MPAPIDPPGHLAVHLEIVALTPILLCWAGALAGVIAGGARGEGTARTTRALATIGVILGLGLLLIDLRSRGLALAVDGVLGREWFPPGIARVSWPTMAAAAINGLIILIPSIYRQREAPSPRTAWDCGWAMSLALVPLPALTIMCAGPRKSEETSKENADHRSTIRRWSSLILALAMTLVACFSPLPWPFAVTAAFCVIVGKASRLPLIIAVLAACVPVRDA